MAKPDRYWEEKPTAREGDIGHSERVAIGPLYTVVQFAAILIVGGWPGVVVGFVLGMSLIVILTRRIVANRGRSRSPRKPLI